MANPRRILRLQQLILETAANHVHRELSDPRIGLVSITRVKLSPDLTQCRLYWSLLGDEAQVRTCERGLERALPSIQRAVARAMQTRTTPHLELQHDGGMVHAQRLEEIFEKLRQERGDDDVDPVDPASAGDVPSTEDTAEPEAAENPGATDDA